uniref:Arginine/serine-rich protein 1 n=1 Tax=Erpetoichthys calabaricus TaxID=27687 RepID=A0A8C4SWW0_ERPCA
MSCGDGKLIQAKEQTWTNDDKENCRVPVYKGEQIAEKFGKARTEEMNSCMGELSLSSPKERESGEKRKTRSRSRSCSPKRKSNTRSLSSSSSSMSRSSSSSSSDSDRSTYSRRRSRSRSRSRGRYRSFRTYRRRRSVPRSSSRSRSRSYPRCCRSRSRSHSSGRHYRFFYKCRSHYRSYRSRSYHRRYRSRSRSRSWTRGKRYNGFVQTGRERFVDGSNRNPSRSPSRPAVRLTEKDKLKLLEIAKANASKLLGVENVEVPASIKAKVQVSPDINSMKGELNAGHDEKVCFNSSEYFIQVWMDEKIG